MFRARIIDCCTPMYLAFKLYDVLLYIDYSNGGYANYCSFLESCCTRKHVMDVWHR